MGKTEVLFWHCKTGMAHVADRLNVSILFQVEQELWEEAFIEACFEEMLAEEEAQWQHFTSNQQWEPHPWEFYPPQTFYQNNTDNQRQLLVRFC